MLWAGGRLEAQCFNLYIQTDEEGGGGRVMIMFFWVWMFTLMMRADVNTVSAPETRADAPPFHLRYRFAEIYYRRGESTHKGRSTPARVETTVLFLPDVWNVCPAKLEWDGLHLNYKRQLDKKLSSSGGPQQQLAEDHEGEEEEDKALTHLFFFLTSSWFTTLSLQTPNPTLPPSNLHSSPSHTLGITASQMWSCDDDWWEVYFALMMCEPCESSAALPVTVGRGEAGVKTTSLLAITPQSQVPESRFGCRISFYLVAPMHYFGFESIIMYIKTLILFFSYL